VLVKIVESINIAKVLQLFLHSMSRNVLLYLCDEPSSITQVRRITDESSFFNKKRPWKGRNSTCFINNVKLILTWLQ
jgi:hypothetical protein